jgi:hypothetical protein
VRTPLSTPQRIYVGSVLDALGCARLGHEFPMGLRPLVERVPKTAFQTAVSATISQVYGYNRDFTAR